MAFRLPDVQIGSLAFGGGAMAEPALDPRTGAPGAESVPAPSTATPAQANEASQARLERGPLGVRRMEWFEAVTTAEDEVAHTWHEEEVDWLRLPWFKVPTIRFLWGDSQPELHAGGAELFLDLIFVGVAYRVGNVIKAAIVSCTVQSATSNATGNSMRQLALLAADAPELCAGLGTGILRGLAPFLAMYQIWWSCTLMKAKYSCASKLHTLLDLLNHLLLLYAAMGILPFRGDSDGEALAYVILPIAGAQLLWLVRFAELAAFSGRESARRENSVELLIGVQVLCLYIAAVAVLLEASASDGLVGVAAAKAPEERNDTAAALLLGGSLWWLLLVMLRPLITRHLPATWLVPVERSMVCPHEGFIYQRKNEFMFLMLGEAVLQIVIAGEARSAAPPAERDSWYLHTRATAFGGFVIAVCLMHSFRSIVTEQLSGHHERNSVLWERSTTEEALMRWLKRETTRTERSIGQVKRQATHLRHHPHRHRLQREQFAVHDDVHLNEGQLHKRRDALMHTFKSLHGAGGGATRSASGRRPATPRLARGSCCPVLVTRATHSS